MARGLEITITPLLCGAIGWLLDRWFGTAPILAVALGVFGVVGVFVKLKLGYDKAMVEAETGKPWTRGSTA